MTFFCTKLKVSKRNIILNLKFLFTTKWIKPKRANIWKSYNVLYWNTKSQTFTDINNNQFIFVKSYKERMETKKKTFFSIFHCWISENWISFANKFSNISYRFNHSIPFHSMYMYNTLLDTIDTIRIRIIRAYITFGFSKVNKQQSAFTLHKYLIWN